MRKFDQWCDEFERYQEDIRQWVSRNYVLHTDIKVLHNCKFHDDGPYSINIMLTYYVNPFVDDVLPNVILKKNHV